MARCAPVPSRLVRKSIHAHIQVRWISSDAVLLRLELINIPITPVNNVSFSDVTESPMLEIGSPNSPTPQKLRLPARKPDHKLRRQINFTQRQHIL